MRTAVVLLALLLLLGTALVEALWRLEHPPADPEAGSRGGGYVAEVRFLPEDSPVRYGRGVFLRPSGALLLSAQAELVFAGHCASMVTRWLSAQRLRIHCELTEGEPWLPEAAVDGVEIEVVLQRRRAVAALSQDLLRS